MMSEKKEIQVIEYENGTYTGEVVNGVREGKGKFVMNNGAVAYGEWVNDFMHGEGIYRSFNGEVIYEGNFVNGDMEGPRFLRQKMGMNLKVFSKMGS